MLKKLLRKLFGFKTIEEELIEFKYSKPLPEKTKTDGFEKFLKQLRDMDDQRRWYLLHNGFKPSYVKEDTIVLTERERDLIGELIDNKAVRIVDYKNAFMHDEDL